MVISIAYSFKPIAGLLAGRDISYGVYLWHMPIIFTMIGFGYVGSWAYGAAAWLLTILLASLSWIFIERPAIAGKIRTPKQQLAPTE